MTQRNVKLKFRPSELGNCIVNAKTGDDEVVLGEHRKQASYYISFGLSVQYLR